jgi:mannose-6-phosphate isomerase-like protein (cupin superfamily)
MSHDVTRIDELEFIERPYRPQDPVRELASLTNALGLTQSRASVWRYPAGSRGRHHRELAQEEVFCVIEGAITVLVGEPPAPVELTAGAVMRIGIGEPLQLRNTSDGPATLLIWGAPPVTGEVEILDDLA